MFEADLNTTNVKQTIKTIMPTVISDYSRIIPKKKGIHGGTMQFSNDMLCSNTHWYIMFRCGVLLNDTTSSEKKEVINIASMILCCTEKLNPVAASHNITFDMSIFVLQKLFGITVHQVGSVCLLLKSRSESQTEKSRVKAKRIMDQHLLSISQHDYLIFIKE